MLDLLREQEKTSFPSRESSFSGWEQSAVSSNLIATIRVSDNFGNQTNVTSSCSIALQTNLRNGLFVSNNAVNLVDPWGLEVTCAQIGDTYYISEKDGEKYEVNRRLWRAGALINLISKRFQPIPDGVDIFIVKWGQAYYTIKQEIFRCKDTCSGKAWIEKRRDRVAGSERVEYSYSLDFDADLGGSGPVGGA